MPQPLSKADWENYHALGRVPPGLRQGVLQSWKRCQNFCTPDRRQAPTLGREALLTQRALSKRVRCAASDALRKADQLLDDTGSIVLLSDRNGIIIDSVGDERTLGRGRENHLDLGGDWSEEAIGTNAIGTALHLGQPFTLYGCEHYCEEIQRWNCSAVPVHDPVSRCILGAIDVSWLNGAGHRNAAALASSLAAKIETELKCAVLREREMLVERGHLARMRGGNDAILVLDRAGENVVSFSDLDRFSAEDAQLSRLRQRIPDLIDQTPDTIAEALADCIPGTNLDVVCNNQDAVGVILTLKRPRRVRSDPGAELSRIGEVGSVIGALCKKAQRLAQTEIPVLIEGEAGVGKTFLAEALHRASGGAGKSFEVLPCAEMTVEKLRAAIDDKQYCELGTLCLDGPGAASPAVQKLLPGLIEQLSSHGVRVIALSTRKLYEEMKADRFRADLYYRIAAARLVIPPLRERRDEILPLLKIFAIRQAQLTNRRELRFTSAANARLTAYGWPGNLREMQNLVASLDALSLSGLIDQAELPDEFRDRTRTASCTLRDAERARILDAIKEADGNLSKVAKRLGIARSTLYLKLDAHGIARSARG